ncbi:S-layer homology domain-containing protein [Candidatus Peregrinibacteria bacterium]|nr:MAG: S-layer homology domain-containing protein [Candidatus Peregrinibacteria bacterium]
MKNLLVLLFTLTLLPVPLSSAQAGDTLENQDIRDYLIFPEGSWWEYESTTQDLVNETSVTESAVVTQEACEGQEDCFILASGEQSYRIQIEENIAYYMEISGQEPSVNYTYFSLEPFSEEVATEDYALLNVEGADAGATVSCESDFDPVYRYENRTYNAIQHNCMFLATVDEMRMRVMTSDLLLQGLGTVASTVSVYIGSVQFSESITTLVDSNLIVEESPFSDVALTDTNYPAIEYLYNEGIFSGYPDGSFRPDNTVNRAELLKILVEGLGVTPDEITYRNCFSDVETDWYAKYVCYAKEAGWVEGYPDGSFKPADPVNKVEALKMLLLSQEVDLNETYNLYYYDVATTDWFMPYVQTAGDLGLLEENGTYFHPDSDKDRKGIAENLYRLLTL